MKLDLRRRRTQPQGGLAGRHDAALVQQLPFPVGDRDLQPE
jgi:hypothetical protein